MANKKTNKNPKGAGRKPVKNGKMFRAMIPIENHAEARKKIIDLIVYENE